jgi:hypothetical protein
MILFKRFLGVAWASPYTAIGLLIGSLALCTGGRARYCSPVVEFHGGAVRWMIRRFPGGRNFAAFTLGHTVFGQTDEALETCRSHELVHVRQYERWGPFMGPAYVLCSVVLWMKGRDAYYDNPFEREAYGEECE